MINDTIQQRLQTPAPADPVPAEQTQGMPNMEVFDRISATNETSPAQTVSEVNELSTTTKNTFLALFKIVEAAFDRIAALEQNKMR